jgi:hypothetical protein
LVLGSGLERSDFEVLVLRSVDLRQQKRYVIATTTRNRSRQFNFSEVATGGISQESQ